MASTIRHSANVSSDHHPNQVPGILIIMNPKQPNLPTCSMHSTYLLFHLLLKPSLHLIANTILGIIMTTRKISPKTLNHSILSTSTNPDLSASLYHALGAFSSLRSSGKADVPAAVVFLFSVLCLCPRTLFAVPPCRFLLSVALSSPNGYVTMNLPELFSALLFFR